MKFNKLLVSFIVLICLFFVGAISAADIDSEQTDFNTDLTFGPALVSNPNTTHIETNDLTKEYGNSTPFSAKIVDNESNPVQGADVLFTINGVTYSVTTGVNGVASLPIGLYVGDYSMVTSYNGESVKNTVKVVEPVRVLETEDFSKVYGTGDAFSPKVLDGNGSPVKGETVYFTINGITYAQTTGADGVASLGIGLYPGIYYMTTAIKGQSVVNKVNVVEAIRVIKTENFSKVYRTGDAFSAKVLDENDDPVQGETVYFTINGVTYAVSTNSEGIASMAINLNPGNYPITTTVRGQSVKNNIKIDYYVPQLITSDLVKYYRSNSQFAVKAVNQLNQPITYETVYFTINGVTYTQTTDANGIAYMGIGLYPGVYTMTTTLANVVKTNKITVKTTISGEDQVLDKSDGDKFYVNILDGNGNPKNGAQVTFDVEYYPIEFVVASDIIQSTSQDQYNLALLCQYLNEAGYATTNVGVGPSKLQNYGSTQNSRGKTGIFIVGGSCPGTLYDFVLGIGSYYHYDSTIFAFASYTITTDKGVKYISPEGLKTTPMAKAGDDNFSNGLIPVGKSVEQYCNENPEIDYVAGYSVRELANNILAKVPSLSDVMPQTTVNGVSDATGTAILNMDLPTGMYLITTYYDGLAIQNKVQITA